MVGGRGVSDENLLGSLRRLLQKNGRLTRKILAEDRTGPSPGTIASRFGSLGRAFQLIGYTNETCEIRTSRPRGLTDDQMLFALWQLWRKHGHLSHAVIINSKEDVPSHHVYVKRFGSLTRAYELIGFKVDRHPYVRDKQNWQGAPVESKHSLPITSHPLIGCAGPVRRAERSTEARRCRNRKPTSCHTGGTFRHGR
jgi:hypothetical protein